MSETLDAPAGAFRVSDGATPRTVLIADDEFTIRMLVRMALQSDRYAIAEAADGEAAWAAVISQGPDVAVLDVEMPGCSGLELTARIKAEPRFAATRVILLTARTSDEDVRRGLAAGADHYVRKPFSPSNLRALVETELGFG
jgi:DNA-binding response OmpR family regulator